MKSLISFKLGLNYRRSKCKPHEYSDYEKRVRYVFALNNIWNEFKTTVFTDESSFWALRGGLYHMRRPTKIPKCNTTEPRGADKIHIWGGISWDGPTKYRVSINFVKIDKFRDLSPI